MAYATWSWTDAGLPNGAWRTKRRSIRLKNENDSGYPQTRPLYTRDLWTFELEYAVLGPAAYVYVVGFFHDHRGGDLFYLNGPWGLYGIPPEYYVADPGGLSPWSSEIEPGYGDAPTHLVRFGMDELSIERFAYVSDQWATSAPIIFEQV